MKKTSKDDSSKNSWTSFFSRKVNALIGKHSSVKQLELRIEILENVVNMQKTIKEAEKITKEKKTISPVMKQASPKKTKKTKTKTLVKKTPVVAMKNAGVINCQLTANMNVMLTGFDMGLIDPSLIDGLYISEKWCNKCKSKNCEVSNHKSYQKAFVNKTSGTETTKELLARSLVVAKEIRQQAHSVKGIALKIGGGFS
jgi:hypothetical protein